MAGVVDVASVGYVAPVVNQKAPVLTLEACYNVQELKRGRYSVISHGDCDVVGAPVVIKTYDRPSLVPKKQKMATREAIVLKYLKSQGVPNITHVWSAYASQDRFHIIMEYCQGGDLLQRLKAAAAPMPEQQLAATVSSWAQPGSSTRGVWLPLQYGCTVASAVLHGLRDAIGSNPGEAG
eukprot:GHUV01019431.1.p1 GENE.GHUV01019431.1~~GHUV01019431.1.p1  ORF type:complete len:180 (+),score=40.49 GHUV01019431.1:211-750(+)